MGLIGFEINLASNSGSGAGKDSLRNWKAVHDYVLCLMHQACYDIRRQFELVKFVYSIISFEVLIKYLKNIKHNCRNKKVNSFT